MPESTPIPVLDFLDEIIEEGDAEVMVAKLRRFMIELQAWSVAANAFGFEANGSTGLSLNGGTLSGHLTILRDNPALFLRTALDSQTANIAFLDHTGVFTADMYVSGTADRDLILRNRSGPTIINGFAFRGDHISTLGASAGKIRTASTVDSDLDIVLTTKGYVDAKRYYAYEDRTASGAATYNGSSSGKTYRISGTPTLGGAATADVGKSFVLDNDSGGSLTVAAVTGVTLRGKKTFDADTIITAMITSQNTYLLIGGRD